MGCDRKARKYNEAKIQCQSTQETKITNYRKVVCPEIIIVFPKLISFSCSYQKLFNVESRIFLLLSITASSRICNHCLIIHFYKQDPLFGADNGNVYAALCYLQHALRERPFLHIPVTPSSGFLHNRDWLRWNFCP